MMQTLEKRLEELYIQKNKIDEEIEFLKEQIKENVSVAKDKIVSGSKEAIELIREKIQNKRGN